MSKKILFLVPYPFGESPSQRFRFEQYFSVLSKAGHEYHIQSFLDSSNWQLFYKQGRPIQKLLALLKGFSKRWIVPFHAFSYDFIFIHRETTPLGPPVLEWILGRLLRKKIIYDFDDAIWLTDRTNESVFLKLIKWRSKVGTICRWSYKVSCGNDYLCSYASQFNSNVKYIPTTIDTANWHNPDLIQTKKQSDVITLGWTGSHSTLKYLVTIESVLKKLEERYPNIRIVVIADRKPEMALRSLEFIPWNKRSEANDLANLDIGIMPLPDDEWAKGKCGFKALQYMALKIPAVVSPVGVNTKIIDDGVNGFLATSDDEWMSSLQRLIDDISLRKQLGEAGRKKVVDHYSVSSTSSSFVSLFE